MMEAEDSVIRARLRKASNEEEYALALDEIKEAQTGAELYSKSAEAELRAGNLDGKARGRLAYADHYLSERKRLFGVRDSYAKAYWASMSDFATEWVELLDTRKKVGAVVPLADPSLIDLPRS